MADEMRPRSGALAMRLDPVAQLATIGGAGVADRGRSNEFFLQTVGAIRLVSIVFIGPRFVDVRFQRRRQIQNRFAAASVNACGCLG